MKHSAEYEAFTSLVDQVLTIPRDELLRREAEYKTRSSANPRKRGPKRKAAVDPPSASPDAAS